MAFSNEHAALLLLFVLLLLSVLVIAFDAGGASHSQQDRGRPEGRTRIAVPVSFCSGVVVDVDRPNANPPSDAPTAIAANDEKLLFE